MRNNDLEMKNEKKDGVEIWRGVAQKMNLPYLR